MVDDLGPPKMRGHSREYLLSRLERDGHVELLAAIAAGTISVFAAACEVGYVRRPEPTGRGSPNARKRRDWAILRAYKPGVKGLLG
jgi:hypothetical protein